MGAGSEATRAVAQIVLLNNSFATLPSVVAEGRRVIGNITRVATPLPHQDRLLGPAGDPGGLLADPLSVPARHLTLLSTLTIGVPAFFLALAPNKERAQPHFVRRVMRYAVPSGVIAGTAAFVTYLLARSHYTGPDALPAETSAATLTLFLAAMWVTGDHRPPLHLVADRPGPGDGPGLRHRPGDTLAAALLRPEAGRYDHAVGGGRHRGGGSTAAGGHLALGGPPVPGLTLRAPGPD